MDAISEDEIVHLWLEHCFAASTRRAYTAEWQRFQRYCLRKNLSYSLKDISPVAISSFVNTRDLGDSAKRRVIIIFRSLFAFAKRCGYAGISPAHLLRCPRPNETIHERILSNANLRQLLKYAITDKGYLKFLTEGAFGEMERQRRFDLQMRCGEMERGYQTRRDGLSDLQQMRCGDMERQTRRNGLQQMRCGDMERQTRRNDLQQLRCGEME
jgi:hypothetical protein